MSAPKHWLTVERGRTIMFPFLQLTGSLNPVQQTFDREVRPGINGIGIWYTGKRAEPFTLQTICDYRNKGAANAAFALYLRRVGLKNDLYYQQQLWGTVLVHKVTLNRIKRMGYTKGGIHVTSGAVSFLLDATWQLETLA